MTESVTQVNDVHPLVRANPWFIEEGARLAHGEAYLHDESLKRIELRLKDKRGVPLFVEVKWSGFDAQQPIDYLARS